MPDEQSSVSALLAAGVKKQRALLPFPVAAGIVLGLWVPYTILNTIFPGPAFTYGLGMAIACCSLGSLLLAGLTPRALFLRIKGISPQGAAPLFVLLGVIPVVLLLGRGQSLNWLDDLIYAPASAISQELYFRSALLVALMGLFPNRPRLSLTLQSLCFGLWHIRAFRVVSFAPALLVVVATCVVGLVWGWQARRDQTVLFIILQHTLFLVVQ